MLTSFILSMAMSATPAPIIENPTIESQEISRGAKDFRISRGAKDFRISRGAKDFRISRGAKDFRI